MLVAILSGFVLALAAPWLARLLRGATGWTFALLPLGLVAYFASFFRPVMAGQPVRFHYPWVPQLDIHLWFQLDGLSLLFALLISGIGALILIYAGGYLAGHRDLGRFFAFLSMFMASMLGVVLADNLVALFVFWELTSLSSYFLIGFDHHRSEARQAALQALLVTGSGGLALLAGLLLLGHIGESYTISELLERRDVILNNPLWLPALVLILAGAFTKSAQFPFHIWLPNAMEAPTPVSAYLHSSTMVKAGIYLLARLSPIFAVTTFWVQWVTLFGAATMLVGAYLAFRQTYLKKILAYSTISSLGTMVMLLGLGTPQSVKAAITYLLAHAFFKGSLFMVAGAVDHETGERDAERLGGLRQAMPLTAAAAGLAAFSMAGIPPLFGFIGKEMFLEAILESPLVLSLASVVLVASIFTVAVAVLAGIKPFFGEPLATPKHPHEAPPSLWLGPVLLAGLGIAIGLWPLIAAETIVRPAVSAVRGEPTAVKLVLWHGWTTALSLSIMAVALGGLLYAGRRPLRQGLLRADVLASWGPAYWYQLALDGLNVVARGQTRLFQSGYLRYYLMIVMLVTVGLVGYTLWDRGGGLHLPTGWLEDAARDIRFYEAGLALLILLATAAAVHSKSRLGAIASLGVVGYSVSLIFILFGAPDLAMTQFAIETLTVILFVLVFYHLPPFTNFSQPAVRVRDLVIALSVGALMTALVLVASDVQFAESISGYYAEHSVPEAHGRNIVNVILVDFRGLDTLGEITVLAVAGMGVYSLLKLRSRTGQPAEEESQK